MLKRALCQAAREHPQTMAGVGLGCRRCHQTGECSSGCQGAPTGWQMCVRLSGDEGAHPRGVGAVSSCKDHQESLLSSEPSKALWPGVLCPAVEQPTAPLQPHSSLPGLWTPVEAARRAKEAPDTAEGSSTFATLPAPVSPWLPELRG